PATQQYQLPITRRLDGRATPVISAFYPRMTFQAAVFPDVRELTLLPAAATNQITRDLDQAIQMAASEGWSHIELPESPCLTADPEIIELIVALVRRLFERNPRLRCEIQRDREPLRQERLAIGVSHNDQKDLLRGRLDSAGLNRVVVQTANKLQ